MFHLQQHSSALLLSSPKGYKVLMAENAHRLVFQGAMDCTLVKGTLHCHGSVVKTGTLSINSQLPNSLLQGEFSASERETEPLALLTSLLGLSGEEQEAVREQLCLHQDYSVVVCSPMKGVPSEGFTVSMDPEEQKSLSIISYTYSLPSSLGGMTMVAGNKSTGKSNMSTHLVNTLLNSHPSVMFLDLDLGQQLFNIPGTISILEVTTPLLDNLSSNYHSRAILRSYFIGEFSCHQQKRAFYDRVHQMAQSLPEDVPVVINMPGHIANLGQIILLDLIRILSPSDLLFLYDFNANDKICAQNLKVTSSISNPSPDRVTLIPSRLRDSLPSQPSPNLHQISTDLKAFRKCSQHKKSNKDQNILQHLSLSPEPVSMYNLYHLDTQSFPPQAYSYLQLQGNDTQLHFQYAQHAYQITTLFSQSLVALLDENMLFQALGLLIAFTEEAFSIQIARNRGMEGIRYIARSSEFYLSQDMVLQGMDVQVSQQEILFNQSDQIQDPPFLAGLQPGLIAQAPFQSKVNLFKSM